MSGATEVTVGIDIGTSSVKALAADGDGNVVASSRIAHGFRIPTPDRFEHDADVAWRRGTADALAALGDLDVKGVSVAAMVPSLTAVDGSGVPLTPGLLYGDERGRAARTADPGAASPELGEWLGFLRWTMAEAPGAAGFWPAQAVANHALCGEAILDTTTAATTYPLFDWTGWSETEAAAAGVRVEQLPRLAPTGWEAARVGGEGPPLAAGCIDALAEQLVAGADDDGDVLVILGTTLIIWAVTREHADVPGYMAIPHTAPGRYLVGGPSNAGGLFCNWAAGLLAGEGAGPADPHRVPVWAPYPRGERSPLYDPSRRGVLADLDLTHDAAAVRRAAFEASGFVTRRCIESASRHAGLEPRRIVATGGGTRVEAWVQALADATDLPVDCVAVPEGGALGSAWLARIAAGLEAPTAMPDARRWARTGRTVEPDPAWVGPAAERYERFLLLS
ncbi:MAG TPA: FGGY-family carbohydrate kinase [Acidimicrobiia bacterium]|nr:FGGY-family carbohydrate kinase [Acidimicrobiia bacterium]